MPSPPSDSASEKEFADFLELCAWRDGSTSVDEVILAVGQGQDNLSNEGVEDGHEQLETKVRDAITQMDSRRQRCNGRYPFVIHQDSVKFTGSTPDNLYTFLLAATANNMTSNRVLAGIDGTKLMEEVCVAALTGYLGPRSSAHIFSVGGAFTDKVNQMCKRLNVGGGFMNRLNGPLPGGGDDKLDIYACSDFVDRSAPKLMAFAQCKTGSSYQSLVSQLRPGDFFDKWCKSPPIVEPVRVLCLSDAVTSNKMLSDGLAAGVIFDRCRIVECATALSTDVGNRVQLWATEYHRSL